MGDSKVGRHLSQLIQSRYKIIYIRSKEEMRVIQALKWISLSNGYDLFQWDCSRGLLDAHSMQQVKTASSEVNEIPAAMLGHIIEHAKNDNKKLREKKPAGAGHIYMLLDFHPFIREDPEAQRKMKEFFNISSVCCIVLISPVFECPDTLEKEFTLIDFPYPSKNELKNALSKIKKEIPANYPKAVKFAEENEDELLSAAAGLTVVEAENAYALSLIKTKNFDIPTITEEKQQIIRKSGILEFRTPKFSFDDVGGLDTLKIWLDHRKLAFSSDAHEFGLSSPKGALFVGIPGTGKSMTCDALASLWQMALLRLDMGAVFSPHVGESEGNMREVIHTAESIAPCIIGTSEVCIKGLGIVPIQFVWDERLQNNQKMIKKNNESLWIFDPPLQILGYKEDKIGWINMHALVRRLSHNRLRITTDDGRIIEVTEDHQILTEDGVWKKAKDLNEKDSIITVDDEIIQVVVAEDNDENPVFDLRKQI